MKLTQILRFVLSFIATLSFCLSAYASGPLPVQLFTFSCMNSTLQTCPDGLGPQSLIQASDGNFYGVTTRGGSHGLGTVFQVTPSGQFKLLFTFSGANGSIPGSSLVEGSDGNLYGVTGQGGRFGTGVVFSIAKDGSAFRVIHSFEKTFGNEFFFSETLTAGKDGNVYGSSNGGGLAATDCPYGCGTIFRVTVSTGVFTTLHKLNGTGDGFSPSGLVQASDGNFYGVAENRVFRVTPTGKYTVITPFPSNDYAFTASSTMVQAANGNLYGLLEDPVARAPRLFQLALNGSGFQVFAGITALQTSTSLSSPLLAADGNLWLTQGAPTGSNGAIDSVSLGDGSLLQTIAFDGADGSNPMAPLIQGADGNLYSTTLSGGTPSSGIGAGVVFSLTPTE